MKKLHCISPLGIQILHELLDQEPFSGQSRLFKSMSNRRLDNASKNLYKYCSIFVKI